MNDEQINAEPEHDDVEDDDTQGHGGRFPKRGVEDDDVEGHRHAAGGGRG